MKTSGWWDIKRWVLAFGPSAEILEPVKMREETKDELYTHRLRIDAKSQLPVMPALGVRWQMDESWTLNLQLPQPRLEYGINDQQLVYLGAGIKAGTFVVSEHFGNDHGNPRLNGATVDYTELRLGPGYSWKVFPTTTIEAETGFIALRTWDFFDQNVLLHSRPAPYLQIACHVRF